MLIIILPAKTVSSIFLAGFMKNTQYQIIWQGDDDLDNKTVTSTKANTQEGDNKENTRIEKLKFEVGQEMGIKPKAKNKKN